MARNGDKWTAARMPAIDGQTVVVTGVNNGLGFKATRTFADTFQDDHYELHVLCNNVDVMAIPRRETADGFEFVVDHKWN